MAKELEGLRIRKGDNGGHSILHEFKRAVTKKDGAMSGGMYMERPPDEEHNFGPGDRQEHAVMTHIAQALGFKKVAAAEGAEDKEMAGDE